MRAYISIKMDRPIDKDRHYISPGGYEVKTADGTSIQFDFNESYGGINKEDPTVVDFELRDEDTDCFPMMKDLLRLLPSVTELVECYIYTGEDGEPEIRPEKIVGFAIEGWSPDVMEKPEDTEFVTCEVMGKTDGEPPIIMYSFTQKLIDTCNLAS